MLLKTPLGLNFMRGIECAEDLCALLLVFLLSALSGQQVAAPCVHITQPGH